MLLTKQIYPVIIMKIMGNKSKIEAIKCELLLNNILEPISENMVRKIPNNIKDALAFRNNLLLIGLKVLFIFLATLDIQSNV